MPANTNLPPRPSPEIIRQARFLVTHASQFQPLLTKTAWEDLHAKAWAVLQADRMHRLQPVILHRHLSNPGDAA